MNKQFLMSLLKLQKPYISGDQLAVLIGRSDDARQSIIRQAVHEGFLVRLRRDFYWVKTPDKNTPVDAFEIAQLLYGPSYISCESALQVHGWIPEAVQTITSATSKRTKIINTSIGAFSYNHVPISIFAIGLGINFIAEPWKAVADLIYTKKRLWKSMRDFSNDMRIEQEYIEQSDLKLLEYLSNNYPNRFTRSCLGRLYREH